MFLRDNGTGTTECGYYGWLWTVFGFFFCLPLAYSVHCSALLRRSFSLFCFSLFMLVTFSLVSYEFYFTIQPICAPGSVRPHIHTYFEVQTMHVTRLLYPLPVDSIGQKIGTTRDQVKNTRLSPPNSSGALAPWSYPEPARDIHTEPGHVDVYN